MLYKYLFINGCIYKTGRHRSSAISANECFFYNPLLNCKIDSLGASVYGPQPKYGFPYLTYTKLSVRTFKVMREISIRFHATLVYNYKKLIRRWDSERELSLRRHRTRATKYNRLLHKFRHSSTRRLCVGTYVYQIQ